MIRFTRLIEKAFVVFSLFLSTAALIPVLLESPDGSIPQDPYSPLLFMGIYMVTLLLLVTRRKSFLLVTQKDFLIWVLVGIALASAIWTVAPDITLRRSLLLLGTTLFGIYLAMRYSLREQLQLLSWALSLVILLSIVFAIGLPSYGLMSIQEGGVHAGAWRGIMSHKNLLGRLMVLSSMVFLFVAISDSIANSKYRWLPWIGYVLSLVLVVRSTSKTAIVVFVVLMIIMPLYRTWRRNYNQLIPIAIALILVVGSATILFVDNLPFITSALGRDLTLTGRTEIWSAMLELIQERPLLGYGFNGFWKDWDSDVTAYLWRTLKWECPYGHNGFMDLLAELGICGLAVFLLSLITAYIKGVRWLRITKNVEGLWTLMYLSFLVIYNISESTLLATNSIFWILYVSTIFSMAIESEQAQIYSYASAMTQEKEPNFR
jgi:exopolysaccharide production protein ExoQ